MHGIGNDYVYVDCTKKELKDPAEISKIVSDRHFGIGSDGLILIGSSDRADFRMNIYNADGSTKNMKQSLELCKFADPARASKDEDRSTRDGFMIRIAEMYLIVAEAGAQTDKSDALDYMNKLRMTRAVVGYEEDMCVNLSQIQDIDFILDERVRELAGEQLRWFDLKRFGKEQFVKRIKKCNPNAANVDEHHWVRPFPQTFLDAIENKTEFTQNTGYK